MKTINIIFSLFIISIFISCITEKDIDTTKTVVVKGITKSTFKVWGNCDMCKKTIENSLINDGIVHANWNAEAKLVEVSYDNKKITIDQIQKNIASVGYDTQLYKGDDNAYSQLPKCCQYDRK
jgi:periplasmic mercuric ion binding protein